MKKLTLALCYLFVMTIINAQELKSPNGNFELNFSLNKEGSPIYSLKYKGKSVINPSKLGLELSLIHI